MKKQILLIFVLLANIHSNAQTILGVDVSHHQGTINWTQVKASGKTFAYIKATEGYTFDDTRFTSNMINGGNAGMIMGAYHFARPDNNTAANEVSHFVSVAGAYIGQGYLPPILDLEDIDGNTPLSTLFTSTALSNWVKSWLDGVYNQTGVAPIVYLNSFYAGYLNSSIINTSTYKLWIAKWDQSPITPPSGLGIWTTWVFKQYSETGSVLGIIGNVDLNVFNGTTSTFNNLIGGSTPSIPPNDNCSNSTSISSSTTCNYLTNQTVNNATASGKAKGSCDAASSPVLADVWYSFVAQSANHVVTVDPNGSALDAVIIAYSSCSSSELACSDVNGGNGTLSTLNLSGLISGNTYYIRVYDYGAQTTNGGFRICVTHTTSGNSCTEPTNTSHSNITQTSANLDWDNVSGVSQYRLRYRPTSGSYISEYPTSSNFSLNGLQCGTTYEWSVRAECSSTNSSYTSTKSFTTSSCIATCFAADNVTTSNIQDKSVNVSWSPSTGTSNTLLRWKPLTEIAYQQENVTNLTSYTITGILCETDYEVFIISNCNNGGTVSSQTKYFTTSTCLCDPPGQPNLIQGNTLVCSSIVETYFINSVLNATSYTWSYNGNVLPSTGASVDLSPTSSGTLSVRANNECGSSSEQSTSIVVNSIPLADFSSDKTVGFTPLTVMYSDKSSDASSWQWSFPGGNPSSSSLQNPIVTYLTPGVWNVSLTAGNNCGGDPITKSNYINVLSTGIDKIEESDAVQIYPNPNDGTFKISADIKTSELVQVKIISTNGQIIYTTDVLPIKNRIEKEIIVNNIPSGVYLIQILFDRESLYKKLVIE